MIIGKRRYTLIVAANAESRLWRLTLSYPTIMVIAFFAAVGIFSSAAATVHFGRLVLKLKDYADLQRENKSIQVENHNLQLQTAQLGEKVDLLETLAQKVSAISGINAEKSVGGIGGAVPEKIALPLPEPSATLSSFDRYNASLRMLEDQYRRIGEFFSVKHLLASSLPASKPVRGEVSGTMGLRRSPFDESVIEHHYGLDIAAPYGSPVRAPADGVVIFAGRRDNYGNLVVINHRFGNVTRYGHLCRIGVKIGQRINRSDIIGYVGTTGRTTGPHLHYEVWQNNVRMDPRKFFSRPES